MGGTRNCAVVGCTHIIVGHGCTQNTKKILNWMEGKYLRDSWSLYPLLLSQ